MTDVYWIRPTELGSRGEEDIANFLDHRLLLPLTNVHVLQKSFVGLSEIQYVSEYIVDQRVEVLRGNDWRVGFTKGFDEVRVDELEVLNKLLFFLYHLVDDANQDQVNKPECAR